MMVQRPTGSTAALSPGRVCRVAEACSADLKSAVSQVCNLRIVGKIGRLGSDRRPADYKSAIRQIENLRYAKHIPRLPDVHLASMEHKKNPDSLFGSLLRRLHAPIYEKRISVLSDTILPYVAANDLVLDVVCGSGMLGRASLDSPVCP